MTRKELIEYRKPQAVAWLKIQKTRITDVLEQGFVAYLRTIEHRRQRELLADREERRLIGENGWLHQILKGAAAVYVEKGQSEANRFLDAVLADARAGVWLPVHLTTSLKRSGE